MSLKQKYPTWKFRVVKGDMEKIAKLAKTLKVSKAEAIRRAVSFTLQFMKKES